MPAPPAGSTDTPPRGKQWSAAAGDGRRAARPPRDDHTAGFALLELAVVLFALSLLAVFTAPALRRFAIERRAAAVVQQLEMFGAAFQAHGHDRGDWPATAAPGAIPAGMETRLAGDAWAAPTAIGGHFRWARRALHQGHRYEAAIVITPAPGNPVTSEAAQLEEIDRQIDDGNLATGRFRLGFRHQPVFVIEH